MNEDSSAAIPAGQKKAPAAMDLPTGTASAYNAALTSQGRLPRNRLEAMAMLKRILMVLLVAIAAVAFVASASAQKKKYPWEKEPGPIAGRWKATCPASGNFQIEFRLTGDKKASGTVAELGNAGKYGYKAGEEIFRVAADDFGDWVGQLKWRSVAGAERWDPVRLVATTDKLNATMTTDDCYKNMPRVK
jgi:hypothetical protein